MTIKLEYEISSSRLQVKALENENSSNMRKITCLLLTALFLYSCETDTKQHNKAVVEATEVKWPSPKVLENRLNYFYDHEMYTEVLLTADSLISLDNANGSYYYKKGIAYAYFGLRDSAVSFFLKSAYLNYRAEDSYYNIAMRYYFNKEDSLSLFYFNKTLEKNPNDTDAKSKVLELLQRIKRNKKDEKNNRTNPVSL